MKKKTILIIFIPYTTIEPYDDIEHYTEQEPYNDIEHYTEQEPYNDIEHYTEQEPYNDQECNDKIFNYNIEWIKDWSYSKNYINPTIELINLENRAGIFGVQFALYDYNYFPWNDQIKGNADANWNNADMYSDKEYFGLDPNERKTTSISVLKKDINARYWAYVKIDPPSYNDCIVTIKYRGVDKTREVTKYRGVDKTREVTKYRGVYKTREVTKYRDVKLSLVERIKVENYVPMKFIIFILIAIILGIFLVKILHR